MRQRRTWHVAHSAIMAKKLKKNKKRTGEPNGQPMEQRVRAIGKTFYPVPRWVRGLWGHHRIVLQAYTITQRESARPEGAPQGNIRSEMDNGDRHVFGEAGGAGGARSHIWCLGGESRRV
jgi:hypothetical protein